MGGAANRISQGMHVNLYQESETERERTEGDKAIQTNEHNSCCEIIIKL